MFLHEIKDAEDLFRVVGNSKGIDPYLVEKDYWIMHALWSLQQQGFDFELKGGTSLSKGFKIIDRFSEDIDIYIHPESKYKLTTKTKQTDKKHVPLRATFFNELAKEIKIPGMEATRDNAFDNENLTSAGIRLNYKSLFVVPGIIKEGILLELGFDTTTPNEPINIDSWAYEIALSSKLGLTNNIAIGVKCYLPEFTFVEKLQAITTKVRKQKETGVFGPNFLRHFYDIHQLFQLPRVKRFIGSHEYFKHKDDRFSTSDEKDLMVNLAFNLESDPDLFEEYKKEFLRIRTLFISGFPSFEEIYDSIIAIRRIG